MNFPAKFRMSLLFYLLCSTPLFKCTTFSSFIFGQGHLGCFQVMATINKVAMNIVEHMSLWHDWASFGYITQSGMTGSWGRLFPYFLSYRHTDIQRGCTSLHLYQQRRSVPSSPQPLQPKLSSVFSILAILTDIRWNLRAVLMCISLETKDV